MDLFVGLTCKFLKPGFQKLLPNQISWESWETPLCSLEAKTEIAGVKLESTKMKIGF